MEPKEGAKKEAGNSGNGLMEQWLPGFEPGGNGIAGLKRALNLPEDWNASEWFVPPGWGLTWEGWCLEPEEEALINKAFSRNGNGNSVRSVPSMEFALALDTYRYCVGLILCGLWYRNRLEQRDRDGPALTIIKMPASVERYESGDSLAAG